MTICIAAVARDESGDPIILSCADRLASSPLGSAETAMKIHPMACGWDIMGAGSEPDIIALVELIRSKFRGTDTHDKNFDEDVALKKVRAALLERKHQKADDIITSRYGISYDELRKTGAKEFPPDIFREAMWEVRDCPVDADLIVYGFTGYGQATIIESSGGKAHISEPFAIIGSGAYLAQSVMMHRAYAELMEIDKAAYVIWEAKKYAEGVRSVGTDVTMLKSAPDGSRLMLRDAAKKWGDKQFRRFGPRPIGEKTTFQLPEDAWLELMSKANPPRND